MEREHKIKALKGVGYAAVSVSTLAILSLAVTLPMLHSSVQSMRSNTLQRVRLCKTNTQSLWSDVSALKALPHNRTARHVVVDTLGPFRPDCCRPSAPGPQGTPGR
ncbi:hypothetical protein PFISCL1PPCAC_15267, partial [Pristionchus fissidentatus]